LQSRILVIPFQLPSIGPTTPEEDAAYNQLEQYLLTHYFTSAVGWVVKMGKEFFDTGPAFIQNTRKQLVNDKANARNATGWAILLFFLHEMHNYMYCCFLLYKVHNFKLYYC